MYEIGYLSYTKAAVGICIGGMSEVWDPPTAAHIESPNGTSRAIEALIAVLVESTQTRPRIAPNSIVPHRTHNVFTSTPGRTLPVCFAHRAQSRCGYPYS